MSVRSLYFDYTTYDFTPPAELTGGDAPRHPVVVVGGGPVGLAAALALVRRGVPTVVVHAGDGVGYGSRAAGTTRRSMEILHRLGCSQPFMDIGVIWQGLRSFYRDKPVLARDYEEKVPEQFPGFLNVQQCFTEQFLIDALLADPLADIRWRSTVTGLTEEDDGVLLDVETPQGAYRLRAAWAVACDGAHSTVRDRLGLRYEGTSYEARYVIMDIKIDLDLPAYRYCWFDPPAFPGTTALMHRQPMDIWRIDYQIHSAADFEAELDEERAARRVREHLAWLGVDEPWEIDCVSGYRAHAVSLPRYRVGHVVFAGDAAHLVPIFGIRGLNSGLEDIANLAWKLQYVIDGKAPAALLDGYADERRHAALRNHEHASKSARFMSPATPGETAVRDAVLSLAVDHETFGALVDPRQSAPVPLQGSSLNTPADGPNVVGSVLPNTRVSASEYLLDLLGADFTLLLRGDAEDPLAGTSLPDLRVVRLLDGPGEEPGPADVDGRADALFGGSGHRYLLIRPDQHVAAAWRELSVDRLRAALARATGKESAS